MAYKINNPDFFKQKPASGAAPIQKPASAPTASAPTAPAPRVHRAQSLRIGAEADAAVTESAKLLKAVGFADAAVTVEKTRAAAQRDRFTVAVVGEFSRGKSTFLNNFLGHEYLPVGNLPTTAVMTRIRHHAKPVLVALDKNGQKALERPLDDAAWEGLVAENFGGRDFEGTAFAGVPDAWLQSANVELIDTPGAGDLNEKRARVLGDALLGCDGAIITISAEAPLSLTEKLFIEERLIARRLPFLLLVITKLDLIPLKERAGVVRYVQSKLKGWGMEIPVYVPAEIDLGDDELQPIAGMDKIKTAIDGWITCPERVRYTEEWVLGKTADHLQSALDALLEKKALLDEKDEQKREQLIAEKMHLLGEAKLTWGELKVKMQQKCTECYKLVASKIDDYTATIIERLQYEAGHAPAPERWWTEDFPYRSKIELTNMAVGIENAASRQIQEDARWYSAAIEKTFKTSVICQRETIADKELFGDFSVGREITFENLDKKRNLIKVGSTVLSLAGVALFSSLGFMPMAASMGVGTGTAIISERFFKKRVEEQKEEIKKEIAVSVPAFIFNAMSESEKRLQAVYQNILDEAERSEEKWLADQEAVIREIKLPDAGKQAEGIAAAAARLEKQLSAIRNLH